MIKISYIIISNNGLHFLQQLIPSLTNQMQRKEVEVICFDNGSTDGTKEYIQTTFPQVRFFSLPTNKGVSYARNRAIEQAQGQYLFILDNDVIINDTAVQGLEQYLDTHPQCGLAACQLKNLDGTIQTSYLPYPGIRLKLHNMLHIPIRTAPATYVIGACQMVRHQVIEQIGLLDEAIFYGPEDCDFCLRILAKGWEIAYLTQFSIIHLCQRVTHHHLFSSLTKKHLQGLLYFYRKHHRWW